MESVAYQDFKKQAGKAIIVLTIFIVISIIRIFKVEQKFEYIIILVVSVSGMIGLRELLLITERKVLTGEIKSSFWKHISLEIILIFGLGILSIYVFAVKGVYGLYLLFNNFNFWDLCYRVIIIVLSFQLIVAVSKIQAVFNSIKSSK